MHLGARQYRTLWPRYGFDESDNVEGGSDRLIDMLVAWGDPGENERQIDEYFAAGANQVVLMTRATADAYGGIIEQLAPANRLPVRDSDEPLCARRSNDSLSMANESHMRFSIGAIAPRPRWREREPPMDRIHAVSQFPSIPTSALDEFKNILSELKTLTESETGTLEWEWFLSADETQCIVFESFADSTAVLTHIDNAGGRGARLAELAGGLRLEVLGDPSDELGAALADWGATVFAHGQGK